MPTHLQEGDKDIVSIKELLGHNSFFHKIKKDLPVNSDKSFL